MSQRIGGEIHREDAPTPHSRPSDSKILKPGDLIQSLFGRSLVRRAFVASANVREGAYIRIDGKEGLHFETWDTLGKWWHPMKCEGDVPPAWVVPGRQYIARDQDDQIISYAHVVATKPGWVAFFDNMPEHPESFRMLSPEVFTAHWKPDVRPNLWERVMDTPF